MVERARARDDRQPVAVGPGANLGDALAIEAVEVAVRGERRARAEDVLHRLEERSSWAWSDHPVAGEPARSQTNLQSDDDRCSSSSELCDFGRSACASVSRRQRLE